MTKQEHIEYWVTTANNDWKAIKKMIEAKAYVPALFFMHLVLEKLVKAHWVKDNKDNHPPKIHNLVRLIEQTDLQLSEDEMVFLRQMNDFQLEGRYPDYQKNLYSIYKAKRTQNIFNLINPIRRCLLKKLR